jgi:hypothetical protein
VVVAFAIKPFMKKRSRRRSDRCSTSRFDCGFAVVIDKVRKTHISNLRRCSRGERNLHGRSRFRSGGLLPVRLDFTRPNR